MAGGPVDAEVLDGRLASPIAARAVLDSASELVDAMPEHLAAEPEVYAGLQRLAGGVRTAIAGADEIRSKAGGGDGSAIDRD